MHRVRSLGCAGKALRKLLHEQYVRQLGLTICSPWAVTLLTRKVVEFDANLRPSKVSVATQNDNPRLVGQLWEKAGNEQKMTDVIGEELQLVAVRLLQAR